MPIITSDRVGCEIGLTTVLVDAHVHIHEPFALERLLDAAAVNFAGARGHLRAEGEVLGCLMLAEIAGVDCFAALADGRCTAGAWQIRPTGETVSLVATRPGALPVLVIAGRQIVSAERVEVLALGTRARIPDCQPLAATIEAIRADRALAVLPWGFGKWWGERGHIVDAYLASAPPGGIFLGDNGGRPIGLPVPRRFARAAWRDMLVLPGSDPLPRAGEIERIGRYGFVLPLQLDPDRPARALKAHLDGLERQPATFGRLEHPARFVASQLSLRLRKRTAGRAGLPHDTIIPDVETASEDRLAASGRAVGAGLSAMVSATTAPAPEAAPRLILMIAPQPFFRATGTPINVLTMCRALTETGFAVHLLTVPYGEDIDLPGLTLHRVGRLPGCGPLPVGFSVAKLAYNGLLLLAFLRLLRRRRFAAVHAIEEAALWAIPLAHRRGVPAIVDLDSDLCRQLRDHGSWLGRMLAAPAGWLRRFALRHAAGALTVSRSLSEIARTESPTTPVFEINDIPIESANRQPDGEGMAALRTQLGLADRRLVVYTGNYDRRQGLPELIQAMAAVRDRHPQCLLLVVGGEPEQVVGLQARVEAGGLADAVRLIGVRPPETMPEYMGLAEVLVSPRLEPYTAPLKIFSYMASGRPIVATDLPTHTQVLAPDAAILVPPTPVGLAEGIVRALEDPAGAAALGRRARHLVETRHTFAGFKRQLADCYAAVLGLTTTLRHRSGGAERHLLG